MFISFSIRWISNKNYMHFWLFFHKVLLSSGFKKTIFWIISLSTICSYIIFGNMYFGVHFSFFNVIQIYVNYLCILWEDNIWIKDQLVHINYNDFEYPSFESIKYIQECYMISNCLHVIWINYYLDSLCGRKSVNGKCFLDLHPNI